MSDKSKKKKLPTGAKVGIVIAAAGILVAVGIMGGGNISFGDPYAKYVGQYKTVYLNGEPVQARYSSWDTISECVIEADSGGYRYTTYVTGDYDPDKAPLYIRDVDYYAIGSTDPEQQLNLYEDVSKFRGAEFYEDTMEWEDVFHKTTENGTVDEPRSNSRSFSADADDGKKDGVITYDKSYHSAYIITPEGYFVETTKSRVRGSDKDNAHMWGVLWGEEEDDYGKVE